MNKSALAVNGIRAAVNAEAPAVNDPVFRVEIRLRNHRLIRAREELGWSQAEAARRMGVNDSMLSAYENLRESPWGVEGWKPSAVKIAAFYGYGCEYLWPDGIDRVTRNRFEASVAAGVTGQLLGEHSTRLLLAVPGEATEVSEHLAGDLATLPERIRRVVAARFDEDLTLDDVGEREGVTRERVRQMEAKGLRLMLRAHGRRVRRVEAVRESRGLAKETP